MAESTDPLPRCAARPTSAGWALMTLDSPTPQEILVLPKDAELPEGTAVVRDTAMTAREWMGLQVARLPERAELAKLMLAQPGTKRNPERQGVLERLSEAFDAFTADATAVLDQAAEATSPAP